MNRQTAARDSVANTKKNTMPLHLSLVLCASALAFALNFYPYVPA